MVANDMLAVGDVMPCRFVSLVDGAIGGRTFVQQAVAGDCVFGITTPGQRNPPGLPRAEFAALANEAVRVVFRDHLTPHVYLELGAAVEAKQALVSDGEGRGVPAGDSRGYAYAEQAGQRGDRVPVTLLPWVMTLALDEAMGADKPLTVEARA